MVLGRSDNVAEFVLGMQVKPLWLFFSRDFGIFCHHSSTRFDHSRGKPPPPCPVNPNPSDTQLASTHTHWHATHQLLRSHRLANLRQLPQSSCLSSSFFWFFSVTISSFFSFLLSLLDVFSLTQLSQTAGEFLVIHLGRCERENYQVYTHWQTHTQVHGSHVNQSLRQKAEKRLSWVKKRQNVHSLTLPCTGSFTFRGLFMRLLCQKRLICCAKVCRAACKMWLWTICQGFFFLIYSKCAGFQFGWNVIYIVRSLTECRKLKGQWPDVLQEPCKSDLMYVWNAVVNISAEHKHDELRE